MSNFEQNAAPNSSPLMTQREVAAYFKCVPRTVRNWGKRAVLTPIHIGRRTFYSKAQVEAMTGILKF